MTGWERATVAALRELPAERSAADRMAGKIKLMQAARDAGSSDPVLSERIERSRVKLTDKLRRIEALEDVVTGDMTDDERRVVQELVIDRHGRTAARAVYELTQELHVSDAGIYRLRKSALKKAAAALETKKDTG